MTVETKCREWVGWGGAEGGGETPGFQQHQNRECLNAVVTTVHEIALRTDRFQNLFFLKRCQNILNRTEYT